MGFLGKQLCAIPFGLSLLTICSFCTKSICKLSHLSCWPQFWLWKGILPCFAWLSGVSFFEDYLLLWIVSVERPCWLACVQVKGGRQGQTTRAVVEEMGFSWKQWKLVASFNLFLKDVDFCKIFVCQRWREKHCPVSIVSEAFIPTIKSGFYSLNFHFCAGRKVKEGETEKVLPLLCLQSRPQISHSL